MLTAMLALAQASFAQDAPPPQHDEALAIGVAEVPVLLLLGFVLTAAVINLFVGGLTSKWMRSDRSSCRCSTR
jgi:hypothetical protein